MVVAQFLFIYRRVNRERCARHVAQPAHVRLLATTKPRVITSYGSEATPGVQNGHKLEAHNMPETGHRCRMREQGFPAFEMPRGRCPMCRRQADSLWHFGAKVICWPCVRAVVEPPVPTSVDTRALDRLAFGLYQIQLRTDETGLAIWLADDHETKHCYSSRISGTCDLCHSRAAYLHWMPGRQQLHCKHCCPAEEHIGLIPAIRAARARAARETKSSSRRTA